MNNNQVLISYKFTINEQEEYNIYEELVFVIEHFPLKFHFSLDLTQNLDKIKYDLNLLINDLNESDKTSVYFNDSVNSSQSISYNEEILYFEMTNNNSDVWGDTNLKFPYSKTKFISLVQEIKTKLNEI